VAVNRALFGLDLFGNAVVPPSRGPVADRFTFPPFSILDGRSGDWQDRKRAWASMGIRGEVGRADDLTMKGNAAKFDYYRVKEGTRETTDEQGTSIFDPVLCELAYRWFCPPSGQVVDPFAGGSVRGIVAGSLGLRYWGSDLRPEQIAANDAQADEIGTDPRPQWVCGDSMETLDSAPDADLIFSCPPYGDLERYSDDPRDLSSMEWHTFTAAYRRIIMRAVRKLKENRFACFVVGDFRDPRGFMRGFVGETVAAFEEQKAHLYNEAILLTSVGSASMRVTKQFAAGRKLCKVHQNVLVFCKGDPREASRSIANVAPLFAQGGAA
jgi:DNA modification methylase